MSSTYMVDGVVVKRTPEEHAAWLAEVQAQASEPEKKPPATKEQLLLEIESLKQIVEQML